MHAARTQLRSALHLLTGTMRVWLPFAAAAACVVASGHFSPIVGFVAIICALALIFDGAAVLFSRGDNLLDYRQ